MCLSIPISSSPVAASPSQIIHMCRSMERRHLFRGWSRLCRHAASVNAAAEISSSRTANARAARAQAVETDVITAAEESFAWREATNANVEAETTITGQNEAPQQVDGSSTQVVDLGGRAEQPVRGLQEYQKRRARVTVRFRRSRFQL